MHYDIFISYRRATGKNYARIIKPELEKKGFSVFLDFDELKDGVFDKRIMDAIEESPIFLMILSEGALDRCVNKNDWVRKEILYATKQGKHIVPVEVDKTFRPIPETLPEDIKSVLGAHQFASIDTENLFDVSIEKMIRENIYPHVKPKDYRPETGIRNEAEIHIDIDADCELRRFDKKIATVYANKDNVIYLKPGKHKLTFVSNDFGDIHETITYEVSSENYSDILEVLLKKRVDERRKEIDEQNRQKELETQRRIAIENERKAKEEAQKKAEIEEKRKKEIEDQRRKEQEEIERSKVVAQKQALEKSIEKAAEKAPVIGLAIRSVQEGKSVILPVKGPGMLPFLRNEGDSILLEKIDFIQKGDIVLALDNEGNARISRVIRVEDESVTLRGDAKKALEYYALPFVLAKAKGVYRNGDKKIDSINSIKWRLYSHLWIHLPFYCRNMVANSSDWIKQCKCNRSCLITIIFSIVLCMLTLLWFAYRTNSPEYEQDTLIESSAIISEGVQEKSEDFIIVKDSVVTISNAPEGRGHFKYSGRINSQSNLPEGYGVAQFDDGAIYEGQFKDGLSNDTAGAVLKFKDGAFYKGTFSKGYYVRGVFTYEDKSYYKGTYKVTQNKEVKKDSGTYFGIYGKELINYKDGKSIIIK